MAQGLRRHRLLRAGSGRRPLPGGQVLSAHHERAADNIEEMKKKIDIILEFIKQKK